MTAALAAAFEADAPVVLTSAYLFGGHAAARAHRDSDIDVGVLLDRVHCLSARARFEEGVRMTSWLCAELRVSMIDLVVLNDAPPPIGARIVTEGVRLFCRDEEADHAFRRDSMLRAADLAPFLARARKLKLAAIAR